MATVTFALKEPKSTSKTLILILLRFNGIQWKFSTEQKIIPKFWNSSEHRARQIRNINFVELNNLLTHMEAETLDTVRKIINDQDKLTKEKIRATLDKVLQKDTLPENKKEFMWFIKDFIEHSNKKIGTKKTYKQTFRLLKEYQDFSKIKLNFDSIDLDFYERFTKFLADKDYQINTIGSFIKRTKVFMNEAFQRGLTSNVVFKNKKFISPREESDSIYLTLEEIKKLGALNLSKEERLDKVRDLFIIGCYTGLRFSDLSKLTNKNLIDNGSKIKIQTEKTGETVIIPLNSEIREIIKKYSGYIPKVISNQKMNEYLKEIGKLAEIDEKIIIHFTRGGKRISEAWKKYDLITVHTARRSFATNAFLSDIPSISIMKITGHRTEKSFLQYIKISQDDNANKLINHPFFK